MRRNYWRTNNGMYWVCIYSDTGGALMKEQLKLSMVRTELKFRISHGLSAFRIKSILSGEAELDFDVFLPSIGKNLQREFCWTLLQKQELILSVLKGIRLQPMAVIHRDHKVFEIIDGKQRLGAWLEFAKGEFPIRFNDNEYYFDDLDTEAQRELLHHYIVADTAYTYTELHTEIIPDSAKISWFCMINFAGIVVDRDHMRMLQGGL